MEGLGIQEIRYWQDAEEVIGASTAANGGQPKGAVYGEGLLWPSELVKIASFSEVRMEGMIPCFK